MNYDFEIDRINSEIKKRSAKTVLIQLPEGLKVHARELMDKINARVIFSADPCFGACDLIVVPEADLTIHFGHTKFMENDKVIYIPVASDLNVLEVIEKALPQLEEKVALTTTAQHLQKLDEMKCFLEENGKQVVLGQSSGKTAPGQVLGCDASTAVNAEADCILFVGSGKFHPLNIAFQTKKKVIQANPYNGEVAEVNADAWEKERILRIDKAREAKSFGIVYSTKPGQKNFALSESLADLNENSYLIIMDLITPEQIDYLPFDAFVITACPRIVLDDWKNYKKAILLPDEFKELIKKN